jgi:hypothetical protein
MVQKGAGGECPLKAGARIATPIVAIRAGQKPVTQMIGKDGLNIFGRRRFLEVAVGALATTQVVPGRPANAGLVLERPIEVAQSLFAWPGKGERP